MDSTVNALAQRVALSAIFGYKVSSLIQKSISIDLFASNPLTLNIGPFCTEWPTSELHLKPDCF